MDLNGRAPLAVWVLSDGRAGIENQALGVAEAVARRVPAEVEVKRVRWRPWLRRLPTRLVPAPALVRDPSSDPLEPPWPDLLVSNGRAAVPFAVDLRRRAHGRTFVVQLQDPLRDPRLFDLVVPPRHDRLEGPGVFPITGAPHRITPERLAEAAARFPDLALLPRPRVALLVGGRAKAFDLPAARAAELAREVLQAVESRGGSVMATFSRRTPQAAKAALRAELSRLPGLVWDGEGPNPYWAMLALADHVLVTEDSINMVAEAAGTGAPVHILRTKGRQARKDRFHRELAGLGVARPFQGELDAWTYVRLDETGRLAEEIICRMAVDAGSAPGASPAPR